MIAVWRGGRAHRSGLRDFELQLGDAVLVYGSRRKLELLAREQDFIVLSETMREQFRVDKAPIAGLIMVAVLAAVAFGFVPIFLAAMCGAAAMVVLRCLKPTEVYEHVDGRRSCSWRAC